MRLRGEGGERGISESGRRGERGKRKRGEGGGSGRSLVSLALSKGVEWMVEEGQESRCVAVSAVCWCVPVPDQEARRVRVGSATTTD